MLLLASAWQRELGPHRDTLWNSQTFFSPFVVDVVHIVGVVGVVDASSHLCPTGRTRAPSGYTMECTDTERNRAISCHASPVMTPASQRRFREDEICSLYLEGFREFFVKLEQVSLSFLSSHGQEQTTAVAVQTIPVPCNCVTQMDCSGVLCTLQPNNMPQPWLRVVWTLSQWCHGYLVR